MAKISRNNLFILSHLSRLDFQAKRAKWVILFEVFKLDEKYQTIW